MNKMNNLLRAAIAALLLTAYVWSPVFAKGGNECKNNSNSQACRDAGTTTSDGTDTAGTADTGSVSAPVAGSSRSGSGSVSQPGGGTPQRTGWTGKITKNNGKWIVTINGDGTVSITNPGTLTQTVVGAIPGVTVQPETAVTDAVDPNKAGRETCNALSGMTVSPPTAPMTFTQFQDAGWDFQWKDNAMQGGRNRTWPTGACTLTGSHWSPVQRDLSNDHVNDADVTNDGKAWSLKLRSLYQAYLTGELVFVQQ